MDFVVNNSVEFSEALQKASDGDQILLDKSWNPHSISVSNAIFSGTGLTISSEDPQNLATISNLDIINSNGIHFSNLNIVEVESAVDGYLVEVNNSTDISFSSTSFIGQGVQPVFEIDLDARANGGVRFQNCEDVTVKNSSFSNLNFGIVVRETVDMLIQNNRLTKLQADGIQLSGIQDVEIDSNYLGDFLGSENAVNHMDMIQIFSAGSSIRTKNISISNNVLDSGNGVGTQTIFLGNEKYNASNSQQDMYQNISISNNLIHNSHAHGITVGETNGVQIRNNTLFKNPSSLMIDDPLGHEVEAPRIRISEASKDVIIEKNIVEIIEAPEESIYDKNVKHNSDLWWSAEYQGKLFIDPLSHGSNILRRLEIKPDSYAKNLGSGAEPKIEEEVDGSMWFIDTLWSNFTIGAKHLEFTIRNYDGSSFSGQDIEWKINGVRLAGGETQGFVFQEIGNHVIVAEFQQPNLEEVVEVRTTVRVFDPLILDVSFNYGANDLSSNSVEFEISGIPNWNESLEGALVLGDSEIYYDIDEKSSIMPDLSIFASFKKTSDDDSGVLLFWGRGAEIHIREDRVFGSMTIDGEQVWISSTSANVRHSDWQSVGLVYDSSAGKIKLYSSGILNAVVDTYQDGLINVPANNELSLGSPWGTSFEGSIGGFSVFQGVLDELDFQYLDYGMDANSLLSIKTAEVAMERGFVDFNSPFLVREDMRLLPPNLQPSGASSIDFDQSVLNDLLSW